MSQQTDKLLSTIINQLGDSPNYENVLRWMGESFDNIEDILFYISQINIYNAEGVWLDLIGDIVGQSREIPNGIQFEYFNFFEYPNALGFDNGRFYRDGDPLTDSSILPDDEYRQVILARIARNYGDISEIGVVTGLQNIVNTNSIFIQTSTGGGAFEVYIGEALPTNTKAIIANLDIIPRGAGIGVSVITSGPTDSVFGFAEFGFAGFDTGNWVEEIA